VGWTLASKATKHWIKQTSHPISGALGIGGSEMDYRFRVFT
jgi:hypothetical protein